MWVVVSTQTGYRVIAIINRVKICTNEDFLRRVKIKSVNGGEDAGYTCTQIIQCV